MRLAPIPPEALSTEQRALFDDITAMFRRTPGFDSFRTSRDDGALIGPFNPWLHTPAVGRAAMALTEALSDISGLPPACRQVAILVTGAHYRAEYELYAHVAVAREGGMPEARIATIVAGQRPSDLPPDEAAAYDIASHLVRGGPLPAHLYQHGATAFGHDGVAALIYLVGLYGFVSTTLNGFGETAPE